MGTGVPHADIANPIQTETGFRAPARSGLRPTSPAKDPLGVQRPAGGAHLGQELSVVHSWPMVHRQWAELDPDGTLLWDNILSGLFESDWHGNITPEWPGPCTTTFTASRTMRYSLSISGTMRGHRPFAAESWLLQVVGELADRYGQSLAPAILVKRIGEGRLIFGSVAWGRQSLARPDPSPGGWMRDMIAWLVHSPVPVP